MIPKIIHFCWFGDGEKTNLVKECIESWKTNCPDYEIIEWNESNFDVNACDYIRQAYAAKKWAFVADYFRAWVLYNFGGIYLDADVKVFKSFDAFLEDKCFIGFENIDTLEADTIGCEKHHPLFKNVLDTFAQDTFLENVANNIIMPQRITEEVVKLYNIKRLYSHKYSFDDLHLYPIDYFSPLDYNTGKMKSTKRTCSVHLFNGSWLDEKNTKVKNVFYYKLRIRIKRFFIKVIGNQATKKIFGKKS